jgi:uncharacterized protein YprB with RNaseH-like and TPR domain
MADDRLKARLDYLDNVIAGSRSPRATDKVPSRYRKLAEALEGKLVSSGGGTYCLVASKWTAEHRHGDILLGDLLELPDLPLSAYTAFEEPGSVDAGKLLFLDTETTGLGGTGAVAFLVGCGSITEDGFEIRQYLIPDYSDESAMLEALLDELGKDKVLVTYNGAAFDIPVLRDRMIVNRAARDVPSAGHIDLLHPTRRLFKRRIKDCSLTNVERELFQFFRTDDIPGYLVPSVYFEWLADESLDRMALVLEHNRFDILSLFFLAAHLARVFDTDGAALEEADDLYSLSRVYNRRRRLEKVIEVCDRIDDAPVGEVTVEMQLFRAMAFKRARQWDRAVTLWEEVAGGPGREAYWANLELAKYFEHIDVDMAKAMKYASRAVRICPYGPGHQKELERRVHRLKTKLHA